MEDYTIESIGMAHEVDYMVTHDHRQVDYHPTLYSLIQTLLHNPLQQHNLTKLDSLVDSMDIRPQDRSNLNELLDMHRRVFAQLVVQSDNPYPAIEKDTLMRGEIKEIEVQIADIEDEVDNNRDMMKEAEEKH